MTHLIRNFGLFATMLYILSGCCSNLYYVNDPVVTGSVTKKNDFNAAAGVNFGDLSSGLHGHASYAISNSLVAIGSITGYSGSCTSKNYDYADSSINVRYLGRKIGFGAGYYRSLNNINYFEVLGGGQFGISENKSGTENFEYRYVKYFIQPGFYQQTENFQFGVSLRMGLMDYLNYPTGSANEVQKISTAGPIFYIDPAIVLCMGSRMFKIGVQLSYTLSSQTTIGFTRYSIFQGSVVDDPLSISLFLRFSLSSKKQN